MQLFIFYSSAVLLLFIAQYCSLICAATYVLSILHTYHTHYHKPCMLCTIVSNLFYIYLYVRVSTEGRHGQHLVHVLRKYMYICICVCRCKSMVCMYTYMCFTENTIVVCSQDSENVAVISKPLTTAMLQKILAGIYCCTVYMCIFIC